VQGYSPHLANNPSFGRTQSDQTRPDQTATPDEFETLRGSILGHLERPVTHEWQQRVAIHSMLLNQDCTVTDDMQVGQAISCWNGRASIWSMMVAALHAFEAFSACHVEAPLGGAGVM
jgi:hypothetical protein